ncbi:hypothetical protein MTF65_14405 [Streptomyces sp. APSN-46.1]|nr:hypothetical protein [Streptomyces sp. APSN-46.1]MCJ1678518.1 hypothetical protein [Streptomyces sp. APSN-46.1]
MSWLWALGTAAGLTMLGILAHCEYADAARLAAVPALSADDTGFADDGV